MLSITVLALKVASNSRTHTHKLFPLWRTIYTVTKVHKWSLKRTTSQNCVCVCTSIWVQWDFVLSWSALGCCFKYIYWELYAISLTSPRKEAVREFHSLGREVTAYRMRNSVVLTFHVFTRQIWAGFVWPYGVRVYQLEECLVFFRTESWSERAVSMLVWEFLHGYSTYTGWKFNSQKSISACFSQFNIYSNLCIPNLV